MLNKQELKELQNRNTKFRKELIEKATSQELIFKAYLERCKINFRFQKGFFFPYHRICDFYIKKYRLIIEIDGGYHLNIKEKDDHKDKVWKRFRTLRILNTQIDDGSYIKMFESTIHPTK